jgi:molybdate transport system regulatory protein
MSTKTQHSKRQPGVRTKLFVADETIGVGKINLLAMVGEVGSISKAARQMNMSYRRAKFLLDSMQTGFESPLLHSQRGGTEQGGAQLTRLGEELIKRYKAHAVRVEEHSTEILAWMESVQALASVRKEDL